MSKDNKQLLAKYFSADPNILEIGLDEVGRGPLFGRVYTAAVILPKDDTFDHFKMKDSKRFHSKKKIEEMSEYIKENAIAWSISYEDEQMIDKINNVGNFNDPDIDFVFQNHPKLSTIGNKEQYLQYIKK